MGIINKIKSIYKKTDDVVGKVVHDIDRISKIPKNTILGKISNISENDPPKGKNLLLTDPPTFSAVEKITEYNKSYDLPNDFIVLDIETTGFSFLNDHIIQVSAIKYKNNEKVDEFTEYVKPPTSIPESITELTGINNEKVADCRSINEVLIDLITFVSDDYLVCHNASFDIPFLQTKLKFYHLNLLTNKIIDTLPLAKQTIKEIENYKLPTLKRFLNIECPSHNATYDCYVTAKLYLYCKEKCLNANNKVTKPTPKNNICNLIAIETSNIILTDDEFEFLHKIDRILEKLHIPKQDCRIERRSNDYLSLVLFENDDFLRFHLSPSLKWFSISVWGISDLNVDESRFDNIRNKNQRHWKFNLIDEYALVGYEDIVEKSIQVSIKRHENQSKEIQLTEEEVKYKNAVVEILKNNNRDVKCLKYHKVSSYFDIDVSSGYFLRFKLSGKLKYWLVFEERKKFIKKAGDLISSTPGSAKEGVMKTRILITDPEQLKLYEKYIIEQYDLHTSY